MTPMTPPITPITEDLLIGIAGLIVITLPDVATFAKRPEILQKRLSPLRPWNDVIDMKAALWLHSGRNSADHALEVVSE